MTPHGGLRWWASIFDACFVALVRLRKSGDVSDEMDEMRIENEKLKGEPKVTIRDLFTNPFLRKCTMIAIMLMVMQQFSGINAVCSYAW